MPSATRGLSWEAVMFAAHHRLSSLVAIVDLNGQQALGYTDDVLSRTPLAARWRAFGWDVHEVDGHDAASLARAIAALDTRSGPPHVLVARTVLGNSVSYLERQIKWHYLSEYRQAMDEVLRPKEEGGLRDAEQLERRDVQDPAAETDVELVCPVRAVAEDADERRVLDGTVPQDEAAEEVEPRASAKRNNAAAAATWTQRLRITRLAAPGRTPWWRVAAGTTRRCARSRRQTASAPASPACRVPRGDRPPRHWCPRPGRASRPTVARARCRGCAGPRRRRLRGTSARRCRRCTRRPPAPLRSSRRARRRRTRRRRTPSRATSPAG